MENKLSKSYYKRFRKDLLAGEKGQEQIASILLKISSISDIQYEKTNSHDISFKKNGKTLSVEIKYDIYEAKSGNIAIEFYNPKLCKPSGIGITKADYWCHIITEPDRIFITPTQKLRAYLDKTKPYRTIACGGDDNASLYLYRSNEILPEIFTEIKNEKELEEFLNVAVSEEEKKE